MTLTNRLTVFFLAALSVVLAGFSAGLYLLVRDHLSREADSRALGTLDSLAAAAEDSPEGLEWEPQERRAEALKRDSTLHWVLYDLNGRWLDGSPGMRPMISAPFPLVSVEGIVREDIEFAGEPWLLARRTLLAKTLQTAVNPGEEDNPERHAVLVFVTAVPLGPMHRDLRRLALTLTALSLTAWLLTAVVGRWFCRRALAPVTRMAGTVRLITSDRLDERLADPRTNDELADLGRAFNELLARLDDAFARQRRFTAEASHQLRTPLTGMLGQLEVSLRRERPPEEYRRAMESVRRQAGQLRDLVEMLLFLARADADAKMPDTAVIDLDEWLREFVNGWAAHDRSADISLGVVKAGLRAKASSPLLAQALGNLLDNACRYSAPGTPIRLRLEHRGHEAVLTVEDHGHGIAPADLPLVFDPFFRSPDARQRGLPGTGLGLAVTARIVNALGGRVTAESQPGVGSSFQIVLPMAGGDL